MTDKTITNNMAEGNELREEIADIKSLIQVEASGDCLTTYIKLLKPKSPEITFKKEDLLSALSEAGITFGTKDELIEKLVRRPIFNLKIKVGEGVPAVNGKDGFVDYFVVKDDEYVPEIDQEEDVDFKNLAYFQIVKEGQMLCAVIPPEEGTKGTDVFGREITALDGKPAKSPQGKNTSFNEAGDFLYADCDGIVNRTSDVVNINDTMIIRSNVDINTGNIDFSGDVIVEGDVCEGFSIKSGRNVIVKGLVESAGIIAEGDVQIAKGINSGGSMPIEVGGNFRCPYIEHTTLTVHGDILAGSIIESNVTCHGNIDLLSSGKGLIAGGVINVKGALNAKFIGNEKERVTTIKVIGIETGSAAQAARCKEKREEISKNIEKLKSERRKYVNPIKNEKNPFEKQLNLIDLTISQCQTEYDSLTAKIMELNEKWAVEYLGSVVCKNTLYYGTRIYFGEQRFNFNLDTLEHCRIYWNEGEIVNGVL